jgi:hypothetical protein
VARAGHVKGGFVGFDEDGGFRRTSQRAERAIRYSERKRAERAIRYSERKRAERAIRYSERKRAEQSNLGRLGPCPGPARR